MKLRPYEILASALAALAAAAAASVFGVKGTLIGAAIGAAVATTVASLVAQSAARAREALKRPVVSSHTPSPPRMRIAKPAPDRAADTSADRRWRLLLVGAASTLGAFVLALGVVTLVELSAGRSLSSIFGGTKSGTTLGGVIDGVSPPSTTTTTTTTSTTTTTTTTPTTTTTVPTSTTTTSTNSTTTTTTPVTTTTTAGGTLPGSSVPNSPNKPG